MRRQGPLSDITGVRFKCRAPFSSKVFSMLQRRVDLESCLFEGQDVAIEILQADEELRSLSSMGRESAKAVA